MDVDPEPSSFRVGEEVPLEQLEELEAEAAEEEVPRRVTLTRGGRQLLGAPEWAERWDARHLIWAAESHLSYRTARSMVSHSPFYSYPCFFI